jgi:hypothetical protein
VEFDVINRFVRRFNKRLAKRFPVGTARGVQVVRQIEQFTVLLVNHRNSNGVFVLPLNKFIHTSSLHYSA